VGGQVTAIGEPQSFDAEPLAAASLPAPDRKALLAFQEQTARLQRAVLGSVEAAKEAQKRLDSLEKALDNTAGADPGLTTEALTLEERLKQLQIELSGDEVLQKHNEPTPPSIVDRVQSIVFGHWTTTSAPTATHRRAYEIAAQQFAGLLERLRQLVEVDLKNLEDRSEAAGAPWTPGRVPRWTPG
jgi:chromosome segregation ATPase